MSRDPFAAALRLLAARERSTAEMADRLHRKGFAEESIEKALTRCRELGYLDDARFARQRATALLASGRAVGEKAVAALKGHGIAESLAREAVEAASHESPGGDLLRGLLERRFPGFSFAAADDRQRRRVVHYFLRRGFPLSQVLDILHGREVD